MGKVTAKLAGGPWPALLFIAAITLLFYLPVLDNQFVIYDDPGYVTENAAVLRGLRLDSIAWAFTSAHEGNWHPFTWLSHMLDVSIFGLNPRGHHATSLLLHIANSALLFTFLRNATGSRGKSLVVSLLFALHPLHVESVAWVAERKDILSTFFLLLALHSYHRYTKAPGLRRYLLLLFLVVCGLMSKAMVVTLPLLLLLLDWWPLDRFSRVSPRRLLLEKAPLLLIAALVGAVAILTHEQVGTVAPLDLHSFLVNISKAVAAAATYLKMMFLPINLAVFYPYDPGFPPASSILPSLAIIAAVTAAAITTRRTYPAIGAGWAWYLISLLPVSGLIRIGNMSMADRYTYIPLIGAFIAVVWGASAVTARSPRLHRSALLVAAITVVALGFCTYNQTRHWFNGITLFTHASRAVRNNWFAYYNLGSAYLLQGDTSSRLNILHSLRKPIPPAYADAPGTGSHDPTENAINAFSEAVRIWPEYESAHFYLCVAQLRHGNRPAALGEYLILRNLNNNRARELESALVRHRGTGN